jgi:hypothetical protein
VRRIFAVDLLRRTEFYQGSFHGIRGETMGWTTVVTVLCCKFIQKGMKLYSPGVYYQQEVGQVGLVFIDFADGDSDRSLTKAAVRQEYISSVDNSAAS